MDAGRCFHGRARCSFCHFPPARVIVRARCSCCGRFRKPGPDRCPVCIARGHEALRLPGVAA